MQGLPDFIATHPTLNDLTNVLHRPVETATKFDLPETLFQRVCTEWFIPNLTLKLIIMILPAHIGLLDCFVREFLTTDRGLIHQAPTRYGENGHALVVVGIGRCTGRGGYRRCLGA